MEGAILYSALLERTHFDDADLRGAIVMDSEGRGGCYGNKVFWPADFEAPPARCPAGGA